MKVSSVIRDVIGVVTVFLLAASGAANAGGPTPFGDSRPEIEIKQLIVRLRSYQGSKADLGISADQMALLERGAGVRLQRAREMSGNARVLLLPRGMGQAEAKRIADRIATLPFVRYAAPDRIMQTQLVPNDPRYGDQWNYFEADGGIELEGAWDITTGDPNVFAAVIDTGIRGDHEDLTGRWTDGYDLIGMHFNARDGDGRDPDPTDPGDYFLIFPSSWHGSHVAGTVGAASNNGTGVAGVSWDTTIVPVRVLGPLGGFTSDIVDGMRWAAGLPVPGVPANQNPVDVMNLSLGGPGPCDAVYQSAVDDVVAAGSVVVAAAGNDSVSASEFTPASCDDVITVAATGRNGDLASYSNYGSAVEISAPGGNGDDGILSTVDSGNRQPAGDDYAFKQGTSMAAPHVTGVVSLLKAVDPNLTPAQILEAIQQSAKPFPAQSLCDRISTLCGAGIVDAEAALNYVLP